MFSKLLIIVRFIFILSGMIFFIYTLTLLPISIFDLGSANPAKFGVNSTNIP